MSNSNKELEAWLVGEDIFASYDITPENWVAGFDADRQLVELKLGPLKRIFLRPDKFIKRFYHRIYPLEIETWPYRRQVQLFDDFCNIDIVLDLRFQATLEYAHRNIEMLDNINQHIQQLYAEVIEDKINQELSRLADGSWVQNGLTGHEKRIALSVCEVLTQQYIQAEAICKMSATFIDFHDVQLGKDSVFLHVLKKTYEINEQKNQERLRQQRLDEQQALQAKQQELAHLKQLAEMQRQIQLQEAEAQIQLLLDKEKHIARQREVEKRLHAVQAEHEQELKTISFEMEVELQKKRDAKQRIVELERLEKDLEHQALIADKQTIAEIQRRQAIQRHWYNAELSTIDHNEDEDGDDKMDIV